MHAQLREPVPARVQDQVMADCTCREARRMRILGPIAAPRSTGTDFRSARGSAASEPTPACSLPISTLCGQGETCRNAKLHRKLMASRREGSRATG